MSSPCLRSRNYVHVVIDNPHAAKTITSEDPKHTAASESSVDFCVDVRDNDGKIAERNTRIKTWRVAQSTSVGKFFQERVRVLRFRYAIVQFR